MTLHEMEAAGQLAPLASTPEELQRLLSAAVRWLTDAEVDGVSNQGRYESADNAVLSCAIAALRSNDYRVDVHEGKHVMVLASLAFTLGLTPEQVQLLQKMRQHRNLDLYSGDRPASVQERDWAIATARRTVELTKQYLKQSRLDFRTEV